jgi:hypothetical protein
MSELPVRNEAALPDTPADAYDAVVVTYDDAPDECTVFPVGASEADLLTTWVSATEGSFVALATMR